MLNREYAFNILTRCKVPAGADFHTLSSDQVESLVEHGRAYGYRKSKNAPGSYGRMFHAYLERRLKAKETVYYIQGNYGQGWEDVTAESSYPEARARLREYRENESGPFRIIKRRELID